MYLCHICSRIIESGMNIKSVQLIMGHAHAETTLRIYVTVTSDMKDTEIVRFEGYLKKQTAGVTET